MLDVLKLNFVLSYILPSFHYTMQGIEKIYDP